LITALSLKTRFPKEYDAWERNKNEIERQFQQILSQRKAESHEKIERDFEDKRVKVQGAVVSELLKTFP
jgi:arginine repressor